MQLELWANEVEMASVGFDISREKFVKPDSKTIFRKGFNDRKGWIDYKFTSVCSRIISVEEYEAEVEMR